VVGYNVQLAVDTRHHLIFTHAVTNDGSDRAQLANIACQAKAALGVEKLEAIADRGYFSSGEILPCDQAGITVTVPKPITSGVEAKGRFGKQHFRDVAEEDVYVCPAGEKLAYHYTNEENGLVLLRYWTNACRTCAIKQRCTTGKERRIARWKHEHVLEAVQKRLDRNPERHAPASRDSRASLWHAEDEDGDDALPDSPRGQNTAATMNPGFAYLAVAWQIAAEALVSRGDYNVGLLASG
jgi:transposase